MFYGNASQAQDAALRDDDQYFVDCILEYRGDPDRRTTMEFLVRYMDESEHWVNYSPDIYQTEAFEYFCNHRPELKILLQPSNMVRSYISAISRQQIPTHQQNQHGFVNLRIYGSTWYDTQELKPLQHFVPCITRKLVIWEGVKCLEFVVPLFNDGILRFTPRNFHDFYYTALPDSPHILIDKSMVMDKNWRSS
jgi:hypothetical protein